MKKVPADQLKNGDIQDKSFTDEEEFSSSVDTGEDESSFSSEGEEEEELSADGLFGSEEANLEREALAADLEKTVVAAPHAPIKAPVLEQPTPPEPVQQIKRNPRHHPCHMSSDIWGHILLMLPSIHEIVRFRLTSFHFSHVGNRLLNVLVDSWHVGGMAHRFHLSELQLAKLQVAMRDKLPNLKVHKNLNVLTLQHNHAFAYMEMKNIAINQLRLHDRPPWFIHSCMMKKITLKNCYLPNTKLVKTDMVDCSFIDTDMSPSRWESCVINGGQMRKLSIENSVWNSVALIKTNTEALKILRSKLYFVRFDDVNLNNIALKNTTLQDCHFKDSQILAGQFDGSLLSSVTFENCNLAGCNLLDTTILSDVYFLNCTMPNGSSVDKQYFKVIDQLQIETEAQASPLSSPRPETQEDLLPVRNQPPAQRQQPPQHHHPMQHRREAMWNPVMDQQYGFFGTGSGSLASYRQPSPANRRTPSPPPYLDWPEEETVVLPNSLPRLPSIGIEEEYARSNLGHGRVLIGATGGVPKVITAFCKFAYRLTRDDSADILNFIWKVKCPVLARLSQFDSEEAENIRDKLCSDVSILLRQIHPLLWYFAHNIMYYYTVDTHYPSQADINSQLGLTVLTSNRFCCDMLDRSLVVQSPDFLELFNMMKEEFDEEQFAELESIVFKKRDASDTNRLGY